MLGRLFPRSFDNTYRGHRLAIVLLALVALVKAVQGMESMLNARETMVRADGIPIASYGAGGAEAAVGMFTLLGMYLLVVPLQSMLVLMRYRAMIPLMFLMLLLVQTGSRIVLTLNPIARTGDYGGHPVAFYVNLAILAVTVAGFLLSLSGKRNETETA